MRALRTVIGQYGHNTVLTSKRVAPAGIALDYVTVDPMIAAFRKMVRERVYEVCEVAVTTYVVAKYFEKGFTALPIPLNRMFHFGDVQVGTDTGIVAPVDLAGKCVGVRAYTVTTGVWVRGILQSEYGVDPSSITWITDDEEHVQEFRVPANVVPSDGPSLVDLFQDGAIDAAFAGRAGLGRTGAPREGWEAGQNAGVAVQTTRDFRPLFADAARLDREWFLRTGIYPIHGVLCVRDDVLAEQPDLPRALFETFSEAKAVYLADLARDGPQTADDKKWAALQTIVGPDPLPYGLAANYRTLDALMDYAFNQQLLPKRFTPEEMFFPID